MPVTPPTTFAELLDVYEREILPSKAPWTQYSTQRLYRRFRETLGLIRLTELTPDVLRAWRDTLSARYRPSTVRRYLYAVSSPLTQAVRYYRWLPENPMHQVLYPPEPRGRIRCLSPEERNGLLVACRQSENLHLEEVVRLALMTGARKQELLTLHWGDVDLVRGFLRFLHTKNKERRAVPIVGERLEALRRRGTGMAPTRWVFPRADGLKPILIESAWQVAKRRAKLEDFHFHDLRHTAASYLAMSGASLLDIATLLGHKSMQMTKRYSHLSTNHLSAIVQRMHDEYLL